MATTFETELNKLHLRLAALEEAPVPPELYPAESVFVNSKHKQTIIADGSGTGRYGQGDNWTQTGDGKDYPGSYGVGPEGIGSDGQPLKSFVPFEEPVDTLGVGNSIRVLNEEGNVIPSVFIVTSLSPQDVTYLRDGVASTVNRNRVVKVVA